MISPAKCRHRNTAINRPLPAIYPAFLAVPRRFLQRSPPDDIITTIQRHAPDVARGGLECGQLSTWLFHELKGKRSCGTTCFSLA
jgi:hypothetical protein